jgi:hypothetical protein
MNRTRWPATLPVLILCLMAGGCRTHPEPPNTKPEVRKPISLVTHAGDVRCYVARAECLNCDWAGEVEVPKGTLVRDVVCPNCRASYLRSGPELDSMCGGRVSETEVEDELRAEHGRGQQEPFAVKVKSSTRQWTAGDEQHYRVWAQCLNCGWFGEMEVPKGTSVRGVVCPQCGLWKRPPVPGVSGISHLCSTARLDVLSGARVVRSEVGAARDAGGGE